MTTPSMLPQNVKPELYDITLVPDLDNFTFSGEEIIDISISKPTTDLTLNSTEISVQECMVATFDGRAFAPQTTTFDDDAETVTFTFASELPAGRSRLHITFTGELNDKLHGFYRSRYENTNGQERYLATTQFEATDARRAFPCWDEPAIKARFRVTLEIPTELIAVSNMPVTRESQTTNNKKRIEFAETPVMSTYLLAFIIGDLSWIEATTDDGTLVRVFTVAGNEERGRFALETSVKLLSYFNNYFGIPYPLAKMDHLAIPDFAAGAMENWGAITYRENALLVDPDSSSAVTRQTVASIISHEMAHQWFGNLVTMAWWDALWLNESFASWMGDKAVDSLFPEWDTWTAFVSQDTNRGLGLDGLKNSHPIQQEVSNPAEIGQLFDAISYSKGGSVLRMLENFLGPDPFQRGLHDYLSTHSYANAETTDLWHALAKASGQPVEEIMESWLNQTGYPYLKVSVDRGVEETVVTATQNKFLYDNIVQPNETDETLWHVPFSARAVDNSTQSTLIKQRRGQLVLHSSMPRWVKVNRNQTGFYRVQYEELEISRLSTAVEKLTLPAIDRLGLQSDAYSLAKAGHIPATQFLEIAQSYKNEDNAYVWIDLATNLGSLDNLLADEPFFENFQRFARKLFIPSAERMGWEAAPTDGHLETLMRSAVLAGAGNYGDTNTLKEASNLFTAYPKGVHADIRRVVLSLAAQSGDRSVQDAMWDLQRNATTEEEKVRVLGALTEFTDRNLLQATLERVLDVEYVRTHNAVGVMARMSMNPQGRDLAWQFLKDNWDEFERRYADGGFAIMTLVSITSRFTTQDKAEDVAKFFADHSVASAERTIRQSLEAININVAWLARNRQLLADWLDS